MDIEEIIDIFTTRFLNVKTNNFIFTNVESMAFLPKIPPKCQITTGDTALDLGISEALNIQIDLSKVKVKDILSFVLQYLGENTKIDFTQRLDLLRFQGQLHNLNIIVQLLFYNLDSLTREEQMLLNEMYYFYSDYFNVSSFIPGDYFQTHFLKDNRVLDNRENYTKIKVNGTLNLVRNKKI